MRGAGPGRAHRRPDAGAAWPAAQGQNPRAGRSSRDRTGFPGGSAASPSPSRPRASQTRGAEGGPAVSGAGTRSALPGRGQPPSRPSCKQPRRRVNKETHHSKRVHLVFRESSPSETVTHGAVCFHAEAAACWPRPRPSDPVTRAACRRHCPPPPPRPRLRTGQWRPGRTVSRRRASEPAASAGRSASAPRGSAPPHTCAKGRGESARGRWGRGGLVRTRGEMGGRPEQGVMSRKKAAAACEV